MLRRFDNDGVPSLSPRVKPRSMFYYERFEMARNGKAEGKSGLGNTSGDKTGRGNFVPVNWVNPYLDASDKQWLTDHVHELAAVVIEFVDALPEGWSLSSKFDYQSSHWLSAVVCNPADGKGLGYACSMRGATRLDSLFALAYVVGEKLKWDLASSATGDDMGRWG